MNTLERDDYFEFARRDHIPVLMIHCIGKAFVEGMHARELGINTSFSAYRRMFNGSSVPAQEWNTYKEEVRKLLHTGESFLAVVSKQLTYVEEMIAYAAPFFRQDLRQKTDEELLEAVVSFHRILLKKCGHIQTYIAISDYLPELIKSRLTNNQEQIMRYATSPNQKTIVREAKENILRLCALIDKDTTLRALFKREPKEVLALLPENIREQIQDHNNRFGFINGYYISVSWDALEDVIEKIKLFLDSYAKEVEKWALDTQREREDAEKTRLLDKEVQELIKISRHFAWLAFYADEKVLLAFNYFKPVYAELARRKNLTYEEIIESTLDEIESYDLAEKSVLQSRRNDYVFYCDKLRTYVFIDDQARTIEQHALEKERALLALKEVHGQCAFAGVVRGRAKIVKLRKDFDKVESGDIIISFNTNPTYVPYLERAAGLVTNEGGMLCHAAIVAREMRIPCVIGTKIATNVFKDGDMVELDAGKAIVRKV